VVGSENGFFATTFQKKSQILSNGRQREWSKRATLQKEFFSLICKAGRYPKRGHFFQKSKKDIKNPSYVNLEFSIGGITSYMKFTVRIL